MKHPTLHIFTVNANKDHVHIQLEAPPNLAMSEVVQRLKSETSAYLQKRFKFIKDIYINKEGIWSVGYFISSIGLNEGQIKAYIERQSRSEVPHTIKLRKKNKMG